MGNRTLNLVLNFSSLILFLTLSLFGYYLFQNLFLNENFYGDEGKFLKDLLYANQYGLLETIYEGTSITYLTIAYNFDKVFSNPLLSLKFVSITAGLLLSMVLFFFGSKIKLPRTLVIPCSLWIMHLFLIQTTIFRGLNDILLAFFGTLLFVIHFSKDRNIILRNLILAGLLALMFATRKMAISYILVFFSLHLLFLKFSLTKEKLGKNFLILTMSFILIFLLINFKPLMETRSLSFDDKTLGGNVNWAQYDYHNAILIDQGKINRFEHSGVLEAEKYLLKNGKKSLPKNFIEMIFFNPKLTIKEFFIDFALSIKYLIRQMGILGLLFFIILFYRTKNILKLKSVDNKDFIYFFSFCYILLMSLLVITNVQPRWFMVFLPFLILNLCKELVTLSQRNRILFCVINNVIITIMCFPYVLENSSF